MNTENISPHKNSDTSVHKGFIENDQKWSLKKNAIYWEMGDKYVIFIQWEMSQS